MKSKLMGLLAVGLLIGPAANAVIITITGSGVGGVDGQYDVSLVEGSGGDLLGTLDDQVWFGSANLASLFSSTLGTGLGMPNNDGLRGPHFLAVTDGSILANNAPYQGYRYCLSGCVPNQATPIPYIFVADPTSGPWVWAIASRVPEGVPEPGTLALLGLGIAGLALSRKRKAA